MSSVLSPLRFEPFLRPMVWGGQALRSRLGKHFPTEEPYGEAWDVSDHALHPSVIAEGPWRGATLRQLMQEHREVLLGPAAARFTVFPWLIKFLDACDWLSVQVHPDATAVKTLWPGEGSKTEAWFVIDAAPTGRIYAGLLPGIGPEQLRQALAGGRVQECLHSFTPRSGDCLFLPAGTVHAVGGGVLMAEIQETSDATFRLFDWNRVDAQGKSRTLHVEQSFAAIHWDRGPVEPIAAGAAPRKPLVDCEQFKLEYLCLTREKEFGDMGRLQALIVIEGSGRWSLGSAVATGQAWILPATLGACRLEPTSTLTALLATLPI
jgi:mannose-6-phosphate isomerase